MQTQKLFLQKRSKIQNKRGINWLVYIYFQLLMTLAISQWFDSLVSSDILHIFPSLMWRAARIVLYCLVSCVRLCGGGWHLSGSWVKAPEIWVMWRRRGDEVASPSGSRRLKGDRTLCLSRVSAWQTLSYTNCLLFYKRTQGCGLERDVCEGLMLEGKRFYFLSQLLWDWVS